jgi:CheY-like chemotaxis protein
MWMGKMKSHSRQSAKHPGGNGRLPKNHVGNGRRIALVVEEDATSREVLCEILRPLGYAVMAAQDSRTALDILSSNGDAVSVLISDQAVPAIKGMELCQMVAGAYPHIKLILLTSNNEGGPKAGSTPHSRMTRVNKPFNLDVLLQAITMA